MKNTCLMFVLSFSLFCKASENSTHKERNVGRGFSELGEGQVDLDLDLRLKMNISERNARLAEYKAEALKLLKQDRELFIRSLDQKQRQRFQHMEEKAKKIQYVSTKEEENIRYLLKQRASKL